VTLTWQKVGAFGAAALAAVALSRYVALASGDGRLDRWGIRGRALYWGERLGVPPSLLMGIAHQEAAAWLNPQLGDQGDDRGPSVGPLQVLRTTAIADGFVPAGTDSDTYAQWGDPAHEGETFEWGARHFASLYASHSGDAHAALASYNGASSYADAAMQWLAKTYPAQWATE